MKPVCRAAIGGLFAIWLAPLPAEPTPCGETCRCAEARPAAPAAEATPEAAARKG